MQVNLKAKDLQKELLRALAVSKLFFSMKGNSSIMKVRFYHMIFISPVTSNFDFSALLCKIKC